MFRILTLALAVSVISACNPPPTQQEENLPEIGSAPEFMPNAVVTNDQATDASDSAPGAQANAAEANAVMNSDH